MHKLTNSQVAIKILDRQLIAAENNEEIVRRELAILKLVKHPNVINLHHIVETEGNVKKTMMIFCVCVFFFFEP